MCFISYKKRDFRRQVATTSLDCASFSKRCDADKAELSFNIFQKHNAGMKPPANAIQIAWETTVDGNPALHFPPRLWNMIYALAEQQGAPSPQELITRCVSDLISLNAKAQPTSPVRIKLEWATYGRNPKTSPEQLLVFHGSTLATIAELWQVPEAKVRDTMAYVLLKSLEPALGQSGTG
jgi:hypothetical protein